MSLEEDSELNQIKSELISRMLESIEEGETSYSEENVEECRDVLNAHLRCLSQARNREQALNCVMNTVEQLNELNEEADHHLLQSRSGELICEFMALAGAKRGFNTEDEDITENWRDW
ncbi:MAG: hypothetical protein KJT03_13530 [Verrucomicrobiae bacterium]|nr:hypothetical protein [Verrucomicrobiae bacterium]